MIPFHTPVRSSYKAEIKLSHVQISLYFCSLIRSITREALRFYYRRFAILIFQIWAGFGALQLLLQKVWILQGQILSQFLRSRSKLYPLRRIQSTFQTHPKDSLHTMKALNLSYDPYSKSLRLMSAPAPPNTTASHALHRYTAAPRRLQI